MSIAYIAPKIFQLWNKPFSVWVNIQANLTCSCLHHLESFQLANEFFYFPSRIHGLEVWSFWNAVDTDINKHFLFSRHRLQHSRITWQLEWAKPDWVDINLFVEAFESLDSNTFCIKFYLVSK